MNSDYHELMGVSRLLTKAEERCAELEADYQNAKDYIAELKGDLEYIEEECSCLQREVDELQELDLTDLRGDVKLEGMLADLEQMFLDQNYLREPSSSLDRNIMNKAEDLVEYLRSKGVVRLA